MKRIVGKKEREMVCYNLNDFFFSLSCLTLKVFYVIVLSMVYIYILSSTDRLFRSIRTLQCG